MKIDEQVWAMFQQRLGYTDEEIAQFRADPRNQECLGKAPELMNKTITAEVIHSHGCNSQHKVGDKFVMDGAGNLISKLCPKRMCVHLVQSFSQAAFAANELLYVGVDPNKMLFKRTGCIDVGLQCGGWGRVVVEFKVEDRKK